MSHVDTSRFVFPKTLVTRVDLARLVREVETLDNDIASERVRTKRAVGSDSLSTSHILGEFLELNGVDIADDQQRMDLKEALRHLKEDAPIMHMVFASDPDPDVLYELTEYLRTNIHPQSLISVGLQPSLVGGVYLRTPNHVHDFSIRALLKSKREVMLKQMEAFTRGG